MICANCNHRNEGGKFCENCGAPLSAEAAAASESVGPSSGQPEYTGQNNTTYNPQHTGYAGGQTPPVEPNVYLRNAKMVSSSYFNYFGAVLKRPFAMAQNVGGEQLVNGIITMILFSLLAPLMVYISLGAAREWIKSPFLDIVVKPTISLAVLIVLVATFSFLAIKFARIQVGYKDVLSRFGALLVPFLALLAVSFILSILQLEIFAYFFGASFLGLLFIVPPMIIASWVKGDNRGGLDVVYGVLFTYLATMITIGIIGQAIQKILTEATPFGMLNGF